VLYITYWVLHSAIKGGAANLQILPYSLHNTMLQPCFLLMQVLDEVSDDHSAPTLQTNTDRKRKHMMDYETDSENRYGSTLVRKKYRVVRGKVNTNSLSLCAVRQVGEQGRVVEHDHWPCRDDLDVIQPTVTSRTVDHEGTEEGRRHHEGSGTAAIHEKQCRDTSRNMQRPEGQDKNRRE
jgi:hypothetical protein